MNEVQIKDFYEIRLASNVSNDDLIVLTSLYQPIIGHVSLSLYLTLWTFYQTSQVDTAPHEQLLARMDLNLQAFNIARQRLEASGLMKTYMKTQAEFNYFTYVLYAPLSPYEFFDDPLFRGMLIKTLGEGEAKRLNMAFKADPEVTAENDEITASFVEVYRPDFNDQAFNTYLDNFATSRRVSSVAQAFDQEEFFGQIKESGNLNQSALSEEEVHEIGQLATLYGLNEEIMARNVLNAYTPGGKVGSRVDMAKLRRFLGEEVKYSFTGRPKNHRSQKFASEAETARMFNLMEWMPPMDFLVKVQDGMAIAGSDQKLIEDLSLKYGLNNAVINALIFAVLQLKDNQLPYAYTTKIAASLGRNKIATALDATNFINDNLKGSASRAKKRAKKEKVEPLTSDESKAPVADSDDMSEEEWQKLIAEVGNHE